MKNKSIAHWAALPLTAMISAALLGGCVVAEHDEGDEPLDGQSEMPTDPEQETVETGSAAATASSESAAGWTYAQSYPNRASCNADANYLRDFHGLYGQCRGPYTSGRFDLYIWTS